jgi:hypothetical protein
MITCFKTCLAMVCFAMNHENGCCKVCCRVFPLSSSDRGRTSQSRKCQQRAAKTQSDEVAMNEVIAYTEFRKYHVTKSNSSLVSYPNSSNIRISLNFLWPFRLLARRFRLLLYRAAFLEITRFTVPWNAINTVTSAANRPIPSPRPMPSLEL